MENRTSFLENLTKPNQEKMGKVIIEYHYRKMNFAYDLVKFLKKEYKFSYVINGYNTDQVLTLKIETENVKDIVDKITSQSFHNNDDLITYDIESSDNGSGLNIFIRTKLVEDIEYEE